MRKNKGTEIRVVTCFDGNRDAVDVFADIIANRYRRAMGLLRRSGRKEVRTDTINAAGDNDGSNPGAFPIGQDGPKSGSSDDPCGEKSQKKSDNDVAIGRKKEYNNEDATEPGKAGRNTEHHAGSGGHHPQASRPCG